MPSTWVFLANIILSVLRILLCFNITFMRRTSGRRLGTFHVHPLCQIYPESANCFGEKQHESPTLTATLPVSCDTQVNTVLFSQYMTYFTCFATSYPGKFQNGGSQLTGLDAVGRFVGVRDLRWILQYATNGDRGSSVSVVITLGAEESSFVK